MASRAATLVKPKPKAKAKPKASAKGLATKSLVTKPTASAKSSATVPTSKPGAKSSKVSSSKPLINKVPIVKTATVKLASAKPSLAKVAPTSALKDSAPKDTAVKDSALKIKPKAGVGAPAVVIAGAASFETAAPKPRRRTKGEIRTRIYWAVFNQALRRVAVFEFDQRGEAEKRAAKLMKSTGEHHFLQKIKAIVQ